MDSKESIGLRPFTPFEKALVVVRVPIWIAIVVVGARSVIEESEMRAARQRLDDELRPVRIKHCGMERFGAENDGGYLLCAGLMTEVGAADSYGIDGRDS